MQPNTTVNDESPPPPARLRLLCTPKTQKIRVGLPGDAPESGCVLTVHINGQAGHSSAWPGQTKEVELEWSSFVLPAAAAGHWAVAVNVLHGQHSSASAVYASKLVYLSTRSWKPAHQERSSPANATATGGGQRLVTSILSTPHEIHDWKFSAADAGTDVVHVWTVRFCRQSMMRQGKAGAGKAAVAVVSWTSSTPKCGGKRPRDAGRTETEFVVSSDSTQTYTTFVVFVAKGSGVDVTCRVGRRGQPDLLPRYVVTQRTLRIPERVPMPLIPAGGESGPRRMALLVGVSTYRRQSVNPLQFCDEDVTTWYQYLTGRGYKCLILGDEYSPYPCWDGAATVSNVRRALAAMVRSATTAEDRLTFVVSGHGNGDGNGSSNLCLLADPDGCTDDERNGRYTDTSIQADLCDYIGRAFVFLDACFSGGIVEELMSALPNAVGCTTCTRRGYGYDSSVEQHGAWTNQFLCKGLNTLNTTKDVDLMQLLLQSQQEYVQRYRNPGDRPCFFAVNKKDHVAFQSNATTAPPPRGKFLLEDYI